MIYMLDTNILIYLLKQQPYAVIKHINQAVVNNTQLVMSFITYAELLKGIKNSTQYDKNLIILANLTREIPVLYPDNEHICEHYAEWALKLKKQGTPIGNNDLWIASHALSLGAVLVTHNVSEFSRVSNLRVEDWSI